MSRAQTERAEPKRIPTPPENDTAGATTQEQNGSTLRKEYFFALIFANRRMWKTWQGAPIGVAPTNTANFSVGKSSRRLIGVETRDFTDLGRAVMVDPKIPRPQELRQPRQRYFIRTVL